MNDVIFFPDGDVWCCVDEHFTNLQESPAGFGKTEEEALEDLKRQLNHEK